jgi:hypothetical protein
LKDQSQAGETKLTMCILLVHKDSSLTKNQIRRIPTAMFNGSSMYWSEIDPLGDDVYFYFGDPNQTDPISQTASSRTEESSANDIEDSVVIGTERHPSLSVGDDLLVYGLVKHRKTLENISGVRIDVYQGGELHDSYTTSSNGRYEFTQPLDYLYEIHFSREGYVSKYVEFDTRDIPDEDKRGGFKCNMDMTLFEWEEGGNYQALEKPIGKAEFNPKENSIAFDFPHTAMVQQQLEADNAHLWE